MDERRVPLKMLEMLPRCHERPHVCSFKLQTFGISYEMRPYGTSHTKVELISFSLLPKWRSWFCFAVVVVLIRRSVFWSWTVGTLFFAYVNVSWEAFAHHFIHPMREQYCFKEVAQRAPTSFSKFVLNPIKVVCLLFYFLIDFILFVYQYYFTINILLHYFCSNFSKNL